MVAGAARADGSAVGHVPALDGVRGVAITLVLALHFGTAADLAATSRHPLGIWLERVCYAGWAGVDLFFVLSGFLITSILLASKGAPRYFRQFYARRTLRIFPLYYAALILGALVGPSWLPDDAWRSDGGSSQIWLWTYTLNIGLAFGWIATPIAAFSHFWTLALEEQFYLVWPWVVHAVSPKTLLRTSLIVMGLCLLLRIAWVAAGYGWEGAYRFTLTRADSLATGAALAVLIRHEPWRNRLFGRAPAILATLIAVNALMFLSVPRFYPSEWVVVTFGHSTVALASAALVLAALRPEPWAWLTSRWLRVLGKYSYGIYVWHFPLQRILLESYSMPGAYGNSVTGALLFVLVGTLGSVLLGGLSYALIERPFLEMKRHFPQPRAATT